MSQTEILYCLIAFMIGWLMSRMTGNGFRVGGEPVYPFPAGGGGCTALRSFLGQC